MKIDKDIPMPERDGRGEYRRTKWAALFERMERGHSFAVRLAEYRAARQSAYCGGVKIITRKLADGRFRIWKA